VPGPNLPGTNVTKVVKIADSEQKDGTREVEVKVWNDTVANLSLLAFGTSAPEILLNVIEITGSTFVPIKTITSQT
jgi:solute carrier family 8 (sodium/calcium exchanger)